MACDIRQHVYLMINIDVVLEDWCVFMHVGGISRKVELQPGTADDEYLHLLHRYILFVQY